MADPHRSKEPTGRIDLPRTHRTGAIAAALLMAASSAGAASAETLGPVTDDLGVLKIAAGQPIAIGFYGSMSGPDTNQGIDETRGMAIAVKDVGGTIAGRPIKIVVEDAQCTAEGGQAAATKLATNRGVAIVVGPSCSSSARVGAPILWNAGVTDIGTTASAPSLTDPNRPPVFDGFVRLIPSDKEAAVVSAKYAKAQLGAKTAATIHDGSTYAQQLADAFATAFAAEGGKVVAREAVSPTDTDMRPMLARLASNPPDVVFMPVFVAAGAFIIRQRDEIPALKKAVLIGGGGMEGNNVIDAAGESIVGFDIVTMTSDTFSGRYAPYIKAYNAEFGESPNGGFSAYGYDGVLVAKAAVEAVAKTDEAGNLYIGRKALRDAVFATKDLDGLTGKLTCSPSGECGGPSVGMYSYTSSDANSFEMGKNPKKVYP